MPHTSYVTHRGHSTAKGEVGTKAQLSQKTFDQSPTRLPSGIHPGKASREAEGVTRNRRERAGMSPLPPDG